MKLFKKEILIIMVIGIFVGTILIMGSVIRKDFLATDSANAQSVNMSQQPKDSDYDGLTDEAEINKYFTDPKAADSDKDDYLDAAEVLAGSNPLDSGDPANYLAKTAPVKKPSSIPWYITRSAAITSYILMFMIILLGTGMTTGVIYGLISPVKSWIIHKFLSIGLGLTILLHITSLLFDKFINFSIINVLIPFTTGYNPLNVSLGIFGFYLLLLIILSSLLIRLKFSFFWRSAHYLVYPLFIISLIHGFNGGSDTVYPAMQAVYWVTGSIFFLLFAYRFIIYRRKIKD